MCDDGAFTKPFANQIAKMGGLIVEPAGGVWLVQLDDAAVEVVDSGAGGVPPVGVDEDVAARTAEQGIASAEQVDACVKLGHAALMLGLEDGEVVDAGRAEAAHCLDALQRSEPIEREKCFIRSDAHDSAAAELGEVEWVVGADG